MTPENQRDEDLKKAKEILPELDADGQIYMILDKGKSEVYDPAVVEMRIASTLTSLRQSWEREKAVLRAEGERKAVEVAENKDGALTIYILRKWDREKLEKFALHLLGDQYQAEKSALEKEKAGLEKREHIAGCYEVYGDCTCKDLHEMITEDLKQESLRHLKYLSDANQECARLKSRNEELEAEKSKLEERVKFLERGLSGAEYLWQEKVDRLTASLARAHEALADSLGWVKILHNESAFKSSSTELAISSAEKALADPSGSLALERWKRESRCLKAFIASYRIREKMKKAFRENLSDETLAQFNDQELQDIDDELEEALEALDAKGERE